MKFLLHSLFLVISFLFIFLWAQTALVNYTIQFLGLVVGIYLIISFIKRKRNPQSELFGSTLDILVLQSAIFLIITITGNLYSPLFFLVYFLGFGITFIFEPATVIIYVICGIGIFLPQAIKNGSIESFLRLGSIVLIAPLAFFFGSEYRDRDEQEQELTSLKENTKMAAEEIEKDVEEVLDNEGKNLEEEDVKKLENAKEEAELLKEEQE